MRLAGVQLSPDFSEDAVANDCGCPSAIVCRAGMDWLFERSPQDPVGRVRVVCDLTDAVGGWA
jgi:hypothetical protein